MMITTSMYVRLRMDTSISFPLPFSAILRPAPTGTEPLPPSHPRLLDLTAANRAAPVLFTPDRIVQPDKIAVTGKAVIAAVVLHTISIHAELFCNRAIALTLEAHSADHVFLYVIQCNHILLSA
jgi:hypothetical protein